MGPQQRALIREELIRLTESVDEIRPYLRQPYDRYAGRKGDQRIVERLARIIVEMASDTNDLLIGEARGAPAAHARASSEQVRDLGVLPAGLAGRFILR